MKLFEHPDFEQAIIRAAAHFRSRGLREAIIEKGYFVNETLRIITGEAGSKVIFKGGTSLSKGCNLIQRFSEDTPATTTTSSASSTARKSWPCCVPKNALPSRPITTASAGRILPKATCRRRT
jgi:Nucleotidyl transferase AbiEii toxin, Type IV TA system